MAEIVTPRPASTILLLRDGAVKREIEVFMMVRHYEIDFNSGALVFPGGSVDKGDKEIIANPALYSGGEGLDESSLSFASPQFARRLRKAASCWRGRTDRRRWSMPNAPAKSRRPTALRCAKARSAS
jgi:hypothetical protein